MSSDNTTTSIRRLNGNIITSKKIVSRYVPIKYKYKKPANLTSIFKDCIVPAVTFPWVKHVTSPKVRLFIVMLPPSDRKNTFIEFTKTSQSHNYQERWHGFTWDIFLNIPDSPKIELAIFIELSSISPFLDRILTL